MASLQDLMAQFGIDPDKLPPDSARLPPEQVALVLRQIGTVLAQAPSYRSLSREEQARILENTSRIADALERPVTLAEVSPPPVARLEPAPADPFAIRF